MSHSREAKTQVSYARARKARDARFDGFFFIAVKTTGIYCRPICPAKTPLEKNVEYHLSAVSAAAAGYRPCLRCRPESAPLSPAWQGTKTTFERAIKLIQSGVLQQSSIAELAQRLGITDRYLRALFQHELGVSPKRYAIYQQCMFAKHLLHESDLPVNEIAFSSGFNSVRRFNDAMQQHVGLSPSKIRKTDKLNQKGLTFLLNYRPPFVWSHMHEFLSRRVIRGLEWFSADSYGRSIRHADGVGFFEVSNEPEHSRLRLTLEFEHPQDYLAIHYRLRHLFDVDADIQSIDEHLKCELVSTALIDSQCPDENGLKSPVNYLPGLRIPGIWDTFEAGVRAILGQQVSVVAAQRLVQTLVDELGEDLPSRASTKLFPSPEAVLGSELDFFRMPRSRKDTLRRLAQHFIDANNFDDVDQWLDIKGIGPWTVNYVKLRGSKDPDIWLAGDAGVNNALKKVGNIKDLDRFAPWRSYLTFQLWNQL